MKPGPPPTPTALRLVAGNPGRRPINENEPKPPAARPEPPDVLSETARAEWRRVVEVLYKVGLMTKLDVPVLAAYCDAYARWSECVGIMAELAKRDPGTHGIVVNTTNGNPIMNPVLATLRSSRADMVRLALEFGMSPASRTRIDVGISPAGSTGDDADKAPKGKFFND